MWRRTEDILEVFRKSVGCAYISDLRLCLQARWRLCGILKALPQERFSSDQWIEAYTYLTGEVYQGGSECIRRLLIQKLQENMDEKGS